MDAEGICTFPCGHYMEKTAWCVTTLKGNRWESNPRVKYWDECKPPDWNKCMFITELQPSKWPDDNKQLKRKKIPDNILAIPIETNKGIDTNTKLIYDGENTMNTMLGEDVLVEDEKKLLSEEIASKFKVYMLQQGKPNDNEDSSKKSAALEQERNGLIEAFFLKALNAKRKYGNIKKYLEDLKKSAVFVLS